jgi:hypothetical protein
MDKNFKIIYSKKLMQFLVSHGFEVLEIVKNKHKKGFVAWKFEETKELLEVIDIYNSQDMEFVELCNFISQEALQGKIYLVIDRSNNTEEKDCVYKVNTHYRKIYKFKK